MFLCAPTASPTTTAAARPGGPSRSWRNCALRSRPVTSRGRSTLLLAALSEPAATPNLVIHPDGTWYSGVGVNDVAEIVEQHLIGGKVVEGVASSDPKLPPPTT